MELIQLRIPGTDTSWELINIDVYSHSPDGFMIDFELRAKTSLPALWIMWIIRELRELEKPLQAKLLDVDLFITFGTVRIATTWEEKYQ